MQRIFGVLKKPMPEICIDFAVSEGVTLYGMAPGVAIDRETAKKKRKGKEKE